MRIFLLVFNRTVMVLDVPPTLTLEDFRSQLIAAHGLPAGRYTFLYNGRLLHPERPFNFLPENSKVILAVDLPEDDPRYHWPPPHPCMESLPIATDDATFANLHLPELYNDSLSIWRNPERAQEAVEVVRRSPSLLLLLHEFHAKSPIYRRRVSPPKRFLPVGVARFCAKVGRSCVQCAKS
jgi:hypothetical protein